MTTDLTHCSFCNNHKDSVKKLIVGDSVAICNDCIDLCNKLIHHDDDIELKKDTSMYPEDVKKYLDDYIIGQDNAKMTLSVAICNHYKRVNNNLGLQKSNILLLGPSGSGKTMLARTIAKFLDIPFVIADATSLTESGYVGLDVEHVISMLVQEANGDIEKAQRGIVFLDEVDKIARKSESASITRDVSGEGVQQALLKLVEGTKCSVSNPGKRRSPNGDMIEVDTTNILFIASGAFVGLTDIINSRMKGSTLGFNSELSTKKEGSLKDVTTSDLIKFGMIHEFIGRFSSIVHVDKLTKEHLKNILLNVKNSYLDQYKKLFSIDSIELEFTDDSIDQIVDDAFKNETGARGLQNQIEKLLLPHMFNIKYYVDNNFEKIVITKDLVINPEKILKEIK